MNQQEQAAKVERIFVKASQDDTFKQRLLGNATLVLRDEGVDIPDGFELRVLENTDSVFHVVLPSRQRMQELSNEELEQIAAGKGFGGGGVEIFIGVIKLASDIINFIDRQIDKQKK